MGTFKLGKMTLRSLVHKPATVRYPYEKRDVEKLFPQMRGHVVNDIDTCILCGMCQRVCPVGAIAVDRKAGDWTIDPYRCIQCASCTHECPKNCLSMGLWPTEPTTELTTVTLHKDMPAKPAKAAGAGEGRRCGCWCRCGCRCREAEARAHARAAGARRGRSKGRRREEGREGRGRGASRRGRGRFQRAVGRGRPCGARTRSTHMCIQPGTGRRQRLPVFASVRVARP